MSSLKEKMFGTDLLRQCMHFPEYEEMYTMMKPDFSKIDLKENREEIVESILAFQDRARLFIAEYYFLKGVGLEDKIEDITEDTINFKKNQREFRKKIDRLFYDNMPYSYEGTFEECNTLADKYIHRVITIQNLLGYSYEHCSDKCIINEIQNFHSLGLVIMDYFLEINVLRYMELADRDKIVERCNDRELFEQLSGFANYYLSETEEYNELYNKIMNGESEAKQYKKVLDKSTQQ